MITWKNLSTREKCLSRDLTNLIDQLPTDMQEKAIIQLSNDSFELAYYYATVMYLPEKSIVALFREHKKWEDWIKNL